MLLAGPLPEPWSATYAVDPDLLSKATLQLVTADGRTFDVPVGDQIADASDVAPSEGRVAASKEPPRLTDGESGSPGGADGLYRPVEFAPAAPQRGVPEPDPTTVRDASGASPLEELLAKERTRTSDAIYWHGQEVHHGPILEVRGVSKSYGDLVALNDVDVQIDPGEIFALVGSNGAGKTTLISIIAGLIAPDRGSVEIAGIDVERDPLQAHRQIGIAPQELGVYLTLTVRQNLRFFGKLTGLHPRILEARIEEIGEALGLSHLLGRTPQELSGGEKRRLHTAMAMLHRPPLLLLDEPTAGVDVETRSQFLELVKALAADGTSICYTTHYLQEVEVLGASVGILERGRIIARGAVDELVAAAGQATIEMRFTQTVPRELHQFGSTEDDGCVLRMEATDSASAVTRSASLIATWADDISSIHVVEPSFESAYLAITGHRIAETGEIHAA
jgi:ABC-2 type transport system ATP-binding protein